MRRISTVAAVAAVLLSATGAAYAGTPGHPDRSVARGACSGSSDWTLEAAADGLTVASTFAVAGPVDPNGLSWGYVIRTIGTGAVRGVAHQTGGSFVVDATSSYAGPTTVIARAANPATGEVCSAKVAVG